MKETLPYEPTNGFFDLTKRPKGMAITLHKKVQQAQMNLIKETPKFKNPKVREDNSRAFEELKEYFAQLQSIILSYWPHEMLGDR